MVSDARFGSKPAVPIQEGLRPVFSRQPTLGRLYGVNEIAVPHAGLPLSSCSCSKSTVRKPCGLSAEPANDFANRHMQSPLANGSTSMSAKAILENVRRYRTIASLCRQTATFRPAQKWTLLAQAFEWERLAMTELEGYFTVRDTAARWVMAAA
jgi:hypothetical protein